jgi:hypothetical protein
MSLQSIQYLVSYLSNSSTCVNSGDLFYSTGNSDTDRYIQLDNAVRIFFNICSLLLCSCIHRCIPSNKFLSCLVQIFCMCFPCVLRTSLISSFFTDHPEITLNEYKLWSASLRSLVCCNNKCFIWDQNFVSLERECRPKLKLLINLKKLSCIMCWNGTHPRLQEKYTWRFIHDVGVQCSHI